MQIRSPFETLIRKPLRHFTFSFLLCVGWAFLVSADERIRGEFEHQDGLMIGCSEMLRDLPELFVDLAEHTSHRIPLIALVNNVAEYEEALNLLQENGVASSHVHFFESHHDTMWTRDYGPRILERDGERPIVLDAQYEESRSWDDDLPARFAASTTLQHRLVPLGIEGGNLLLNGKGLALTAGYPPNAELFTAEEQAAFIASLKSFYRLNQVVVLENLIGEPTGHVDMFATFTDSHTVIVGQYREQYDPENAAILNRNAERLSQVETPEGPLTVLRIPMPPNEDDVWRSYTNVVFANGVLLVPIYPGIDPAGRLAALKTFSTALPNWDVKTIDASGVIQSEGALHCVVMNLGHLGVPLNFPPPTRLPDDDDLPWTPDWDLETKRILAALDEADSNISPPPNTTIR